MPTLLVKMKAKPASCARFEEVLRELVRETRKHEPGCLRYEYWRGAEPCMYYCLLSFTDNAAFYTHQASDYHEVAVPELFTMFEDFGIEYVDPIEAGGSDLPLTDTIGLPPGAPAPLLASMEKYPIAVQAWWQSLRGRA